MYDHLTFKELEKYIEEAEMFGVSKVARGPGGFVEAYKKAKAIKNMSQEWQRKRINFIKRTLAQYKKNPTHRRRLALIMWAFDPAV